MIPAMMTGTMSTETPKVSGCDIGRHVFKGSLGELGGILLTIKSGLKTPMAEMPTPDLAVP